jgi:hypothetical protein
MKLPSMLYAQEYFEGHRRLNPYSVLCHHIRVIWNGRRPNNPREPLKESNFGLQRTAMLVLLLSAFLFPVNLVRMATCRLGFYGRYISIEVYVLCALLILLLILFLRGYTSVVLQCQSTITIPEFLFVTYATRSCCSFRTLIAYSRG